LSILLVRVQASLSVHSSSFPSFFLNFIRHDFPFVEGGRTFRTRHIIIYTSCQKRRTGINAVICDPDAVLVTGVYRDLVQKAFKATK
jgi:hypothetical protein